MIPQQGTPESDRHTTQSPRVAAQTIQLSAATVSPQRRIAIAVDLSDESAYAVKWAVQNYIRPGDAVTLLHVRPTSILYGADWGSIHLSLSLEATKESQQKVEDDLSALTATKVQDLSQPLVEALIPFKIHIVKDHDMKERLCIEAERLGLSTVIMGSRGFGASRRKNIKGRLGSVSDYCVHHCVCPVVVVRYPDDAGPVQDLIEGAQQKEKVELKPVPDDAANEQKKVMAASSSKKIKLKTSDAEIFEVDRAVVMESQTITFLIMMMEDDYEEENGVPMEVVEKEISIPEVSSEMLSMAIEYCIKHLEASAAKQPLHPEEKAKLKAWDKEFIDLDLDTLYDLVLAANYLKIQGLLDLTCKKVASMINGKTPEEVRKTFNIENDLTPEEEEKVREDYKWAYM